MATTKMRSLAKPRIAPPPGARPVTKWEDGSMSKTVKGQRLAYDPDTKVWRKAKASGSPMPKGSSKRGTVR